ncbi:hypothetical protein MSS4_04796 [Mycobacterium marinum]|uniref:hypothetical protein n=1 Tax=Mycobacterium marinum TaxID=1781 RepID=UPI000E3DFF6E|nr:hypothetical protein [Mycobacterium marinum]RFZ42404.1 hypothetical protein MSS4_04796 [Mycobacterium marinum]
MSKAFRLPVIILAGWAVIAGCTSGRPAPPAASAPSSSTSAVNPATPMTTRTGASPTTTAPCVGLSICPPPPPDAEGNPACFYSDGWQPTSSGSGIEVWYFHEPQDMSKSGKVTAVVRKKDGSNESQDAIIEAGQQVHRFEFPTVDQSAVDEVFLDTGNSRCFVTGGSS